MKAKLHWQHFLLFLAVAAGLVIIAKLNGMSNLGTAAFSLGIFLLLLLGDHYAAQYDARKERERRQREKEESERES